MNCVDYEKYITSYFAGTLGDDETLDLFEHLEICSSCNEEFLVQHLVTISLSNSDDLEDLNSSNEINSKKREIFRRIHKNDVSERAYLGFVYLGVMVVVMALLLIFM